MPKNVGDLSTRSHVIDLTATEASHYEKITAGLAMKAARGGEPLIFYTVVCKKTRHARISPATIR